MFRYRGIIALALILSLVSVQILPRRADAIIPAVAAAAAAYGMTEGAFLAIGGAYLASVGYVAQDQISKAKLCAVLGDTASAETMEAFADAYNHIDENGDFQLFISQGMIDDVANVENGIQSAVDSGEDIAYKEVVEPETVSTLTTAGSVPLGGGLGICEMIVDYSATAGGNNELYLSAGNSYWWTGVRITSSRDYRTDGIWQTLYYTPFIDGVSQGGSMLYEIWKADINDTVIFPSFTVAIAVDEDTAAVFVDGVEIVNQSHTGQKCLENISWGTMSPATIIYYEVSAVNEAPLSPGDFDYNKLAAAVLAGMAGTSIAGNVGAGTYAAPTIVPPGTWPTTQDTTGIIGALGNIWNLVNQKLGAVIALVGALPVAIATAFQGTPEQTVDWEPIRAVGVGLTTAFPFSLPWDVHRIFTALNGTEWSGIAEINVQSVLADFDFDINLESWFGGIRPLVKTAELLCFDLSLILATRKLLGGAQ